jgi:Ca2+-binding EF-hand superfamily protein
MMNEVDDEILSDKELRDIFDFFNLFDKDHDGFVNADDVHYGVASYGGALVPIEDAKQIIHTIDSDGDGNADFGEFCKYVGGC